MEIVEENEVTGKKRKLSESAEFIPNKRRKVDPDVEKQIIEELLSDIKTEECTGDEELLLTSDDETQLKQLIDRLPDLNQRFGYNKQTPLMVMIESGMTDLAQYLIEEKNVDLTIVDENEQSALHYACEYDEEEIACIIIERMKHDRDYLDQLDGDAMAPLIFAVQNGSTKTVAKLLDLNVTWHYTYDNQEEMNALLEANDVNIFKEFQNRLSSAYWKYIEKSQEQAKIVNRALENSNIEILKEVLPRFTLDNYFGGNDDDSGERDDSEIDEDDSLAIAIKAGNEEIIRYLQGRKAWFKNLGHVAVDTDDMHIVKLMNEFGDMTGDVRSMKLTYEAALENENYDMLEYLLTKTDLKRDLEIEETLLSLKVAFLCPESSSCARLLIEHKAELPRSLESRDMNPFGQDFYDRYLRSHIFGPKIAWWSPEESNYIRDLSCRSAESTLENESNDGDSHLIGCSNDSKRAIFGYFNCLEDIHSVMVTCKQFCEIIQSQEYWKAQWFATYELAVINDSDDIDWKQLFIDMDKLLKTRTVDEERKYRRWTFKENCRIARVCVLEGSYRYEVRGADGTTSVRTVEPDATDPASHFITCSLNEDINFNVEESPLPMNKIKQFLPSGQIELVTYHCLPDM